MLHSPNKQEQLYMKKAMCTEDVGVVDPQRERDINTVDKIHEKLRQKVLTGYMAVLKANGLVKATEKLNEFITKSRRIHPTEFEDDIEWVRMEIAKRCKLHSGAAELSS